MKNNFYKLLPINMLFPHALELILFLLGLLRIRKNPEREARSIFIRSTVALAFINFLFLFPVSFINPMLNSFFQFIVQGLVSLVTSIIYYQLLKDLFIESKR